MDSMDEEYLRKEKRVEHILNGLNIFKNKHFERTNEELEIKEDSAQIITLLYFTVLEKEVKPFVPKRINRYKIASITELAIVKVQPFKSPNGNNEREVNAKFAFFTTISIILDISVDFDNFNKPSGHIRIENLFETVKNQKLIWLEAKDPNDYPIFINALKLYVFFELYHLRFQALAS